MYPVVIGNGRSTTSDTIIGGYHVPKGVREKITFELNLKMRSLQCDFVLMRYNIDIKKLNINCIYQSIYQYNQII